MITTTRTAKNTQNRPLCSGACVFLVLVTRKKRNYMRKIALHFTYYYDIIAVPKDIAKNIEKIRRQFDKWLYDKTNDHGYWLCINGKKQAVSFDSNAFVEYLNKVHLFDCAEKACIIQTSVLKLELEMPVLYF